MISRYAVSLSIVIMLVNGIPGRTRTYSLGGRSSTLYPVELRGRIIRRQTYYDESLSLPVKRNRIELQDHVYRARTILLPLLKSMPPLTLETHKPPLKWPERQW